VGHGRVSDRAEQDRVVPADLVKDRFGQRLAGTAPAPRAQVVVGGVQADVRRRRREHLEGLGRYLGADAVASDHGELDR
jgi:hypothetical protein